MTEHRFIGFGYADKIKKSDSYTRWIKCSDRLTVRLVRQLNQIESFELFE